MVVRYHPFLTVAAIAVPALAASAIEIPPTPTFETPQFACDSSGLSGGSVKWDDGLEFMPSIAFGATEQDATNFNAFDCSENKFSSNLTANKVNVSDIHIVKLQDKSSATLYKFDSNPITSIVEHKVFDDATSSYKYNTYWDIKFDVKAYDAKGDFLKEYQDFIGLKYDAGDQFIDMSNASLFFDKDGNLVLDPPNPGGTLSLYADPVVPEPSTLVLLGTGLLGIGTAVRRRLGW